MKKCFSILRKAKKLQFPTPTNGQNDTTWQPRSLMNPFPFLGHQPSLSSACSAFPLVPLSLSTSKTLLVSSLNFYCTMSSQSKMGNDPQETGKNMKDQLREGCGDDNPKTGVSADYIIPHILNLYASRATPQDYEIYAPHATFEDPLMCAHGVKQIKSAFYSLGKVFTESRIVSYDVKENVISPGKTEILIDNKQYYKFLGKGIDMISLIKLYTENGKVVRHEDWWDKKPLWNRETVRAPLVGRFTEGTRRLSMLATHALMGFGKDPRL